VALKYAIQVNGVTQLMMMKGDVLPIRNFKSLNLQPQRRKIAHFPYNIEPKNNPVIKTLKGGKLI
jgi:adenylosuccinate synthase